MVQGGIGEGELEEPESLRSRDKAKLDAFETDTRGEKR